MSFPPVPPFPFPLPVEIRPVRNIVGISPAGSAAGTVLAPFKIGSTTATVTTTIVADAVVRERHEDELELTEQPVENLAAITDHAYKLPAELELEYGWAMGSRQNSTLDPDFLKNLYTKVLNLQIARVLCTVNTGKRIYNNMLVARIVTESDKDHENILSLRLVLKEILMATTTLVPLSDAASQALPQQTASVVPQGSQSLQPAPNFNGTP